MPCFPRIAILALVLAAVAAPVAWAGPPSPPKNDKEKAFDRAVLAYKREYPVAKAALLREHRARLVHLRQELAAAGGIKLADVRDEKQAAVRREIAGLEAAITSLNANEVPVPPVKFSVNPGSLSAIRDLNERSFRSRFSDIYHNILSFSVVSQVAVVRREEHSVEIHGGVRLNRPPTFHVIGHRDETMDYQVMIAGETKPLALELSDLAGKLFYFPGVTVNATDDRGQKEELIAAYMFDVKEVHAAVYPPRNRPPAALETAVAPSDRLERPGQSESKPNPVPHVPHADVELPEPGQAEG